MPVTSSPNHEQLEASEKYMNSAKTRTRGHSRSQRGAISPLQISTTTKYFHQDTSGNESLRDDQCKFDGEHKRRMKGGYANTTDVAEINAPVDQRIVDNPGSRSQSQQPSHQIMYSIKTFGNEHIQSGSHTISNTSKRFSSPHTQLILLTSASTSVNRGGALSAILIALPFALIPSLWSPVYSLPLNFLYETISSKNRSLNGMSRDQTLTIVPSLSLFAVCILTSGTLLLVAVIGKVKVYAQVLEKQSRRSSRSVVSMGTFHRVLSRILSVGLPFYAAGKLGGERVGIVLLTGLASNFIGTRPKTYDLNQSGMMAKIILPHKWIIGVLVLQVSVDHLGLSKAPNPWQAMLGHIALGISVFAIPPPFPTARPRFSSVTSPVSKRMQQSQLPGSPLDGISHASDGEYVQNAISPLISTPWDSDLTVGSGVLVGILGVLVFLLFPTGPDSIEFITVIEVGLIVLASAASLIIAVPKHLHSSGHVGALIGLCFTVLVSELLFVHSFFEFIMQIAVVVASWSATNLGIHSKRPRTISAPMLNHTYHHSHSKESHSKLTGLFLNVFQRSTLMRSILVEKDSRRIFYFMCLNFGFMIIQTFYGYVSKSLGLLSDSVHMFFDCVALLVGLAAAVMSKWPSDIRFPYGYGMIDTLAGFANGVFLMLISLEIVYEAIERLVEGVQMQRITELLIVSTLGLAVNCVGMLAFGHAHHGHDHHGHDHHGHDHHGHDHHGHDHHGHDHHGHDHHGHDHHGHDHHGHSQSQIHESIQVPDPDKPSGDVQRSEYAHSHVAQAHDSSVDHTTNSHAHSHATSHAHSHGNENMLGIWLHILADTLGSAAVVVSTILVHYTGWPGFDPLASCIIAILIFASAVPLVMSTAKRLLLTVPDSTEFDIREAIGGVRELPGVVGVTSPRIWANVGEARNVQGSMHLLVTRNADLQDVRERAMQYLKQKDMDILVQVDKEGDSRCWCGGKMGS